MGLFSFRKEERLKKEKLIQELFSKGSSFHLYPFRIFFFTHPDKEIKSTQTLFSVPARNFKRAVDRNTIKRRSKEAFRLLKNNLVIDSPLVLGFVYTSNKIESFELIKSATQKVLLKLAEGARKK